MSEIDVPLGERSYKVVIENGLLDRIGTHLAPPARDRRLVVVSDETVWACQGERFLKGLEPLETSTIILPPGEASKDWARLIELVDRLLELGVERADHLVAFGGGMIGDLAGFAAAILKRGCSYVQVPTSLLAQVDSSVGGKTAINTWQGKNLAGAFHQPAAVLIDPTTLDTLPERQVQAGYAEVVKYGLIGDPAFFAWCEARGEALMAGHAAARLHAIETSVRAKAAIVAEDERETAGRRALLNFGHTFAHALEAETDFSDRLLHGEAVALGMALAFRFSAERGLCSGADADRVAAHLESAGLPTTLAAAGVETDGDRLAPHMESDKKRASGRLPFILARGIGAAFVDESVSIEEVRDFLDRETG